jgi:tetratricopeptide (TPR) repeat protein
MDSPNIASVTLAEIYLDQGYPEKAIEIYTELIRLKPHNEMYSKRLAKLKKDFKASQKKTGPLKNLRNKLWSR